MKLTTLILSGLLVLGTGLTGNALAHDGGRGYYKHGDSHRYQGPHRPHWRKHPHYRGLAYKDRRHWRHPTRQWRPRHHDDSWYGVYLYFGGR